MGSVRGSLWTPHSIFLSRTSAIPFSCPFPIAVCCGLHTQLSSLPIHHVYECAGLWILCFSFFCPWLWSLLLCLPACLVWAGMPSGQKREVGCWPSRENHHQLAGIGNSSTCHYHWGQLSFLKLIWEGSRKLVNSSAFLLSCQDVGDRRRRVRGESWWCYTCILGLLCHVLFLFISEKTNEQTFKKLNLKPGMSLMSRVHAWNAWP